MEVFMKTKLQILMMALGMIIFLFAENNLSAQNHWDKYDGNPVLEGFLNPPGSVGSPVVIYDEGVFKLWYVGTGGLTALEQIYYSESTDGYEWTENEEPVIGTGENGAWDYERMPGSVIRMGDTLKMWYSGTSDNFLYDNSIGYAKRHINDDEWIVYPSPVLQEGEPTRWDEDGVFQPVVYHDGETYHMWYSGYEEGPWQTTPMKEGYATSVDGVVWEKYAENPVLSPGPDGTFYDMWIIATSVLFEDAKYHLFFTGWDGESADPTSWTIGYATSADGIVWVVENNDEPILEPDDAGDWDEDNVRYSSVLFHNDQYIMWYDGKGNNTKIGYASSDPVGVFQNNNQLNAQLNLSPNPVNKETIIQFHLAKKSNVIIEIFNQEGESIKTLLDKELPYGEQKILFNGSQLSSGIYVCVLKTIDGISSAKLIKL